MENAATHLPDDPQALKDIVFKVRSMNDELVIKNGELAKKISKLEADIFVYRRELFGRKTEKGAEIDPGQINLFNEAEVYSDGTGVLTNKL